MAILEMVELAVAGNDGGEVLRVPGEAVYRVYVPAVELERVTVDGRLFLRFGATGAFGSLLFDTSSGNVVEKLDGDPEVSLVNTSLDAFNRCLEAFSVKFPLAEIDDEDEEEERNNSVAREIERELRLIDPEGYREDSFWYEVRWGVAIGDFSD
jgi:hypothetical protein